MNTRKAIVLAVAALVMGVVLGTLGIANAGTGTPLKAPVAASSATSAAACPKAANGTCPSDASGTCPTGGQCPSGGACGTAAAPTN